jgi:phage shock protein B
MEIGETISAIVVIPTIFLGLPWLIFHYITRWKQAASLSMTDETLLDDLHDLARRLDSRMTSIERIIAADRDTRKGL